MCKCDPTCRTPFCGKPGCEMPKQVDKKKPRYFLCIQGFQKVYLGSHLSSIERNIGGFLGVERLENLEGTALVITRQDLTDKELENKCLIKDAKV